MKKIGENFEIAVTKDQIIEATLTKPAVPPPAPENAAKPVFVHGSDTKPAATH